MPARLVTQAELAEVLPVTSRQIRRLVAEGLPTERLGRRTMYPLAEAVAWYVEYREALVANRQADAKNAKARKAVADADMAELRTAEYRRTLIPAEHYHTALNRILERLRARIISIPGAWGPVLVAHTTIPDMVGALEDRTGELLDTLREDMEAEADAQEEEAALA